MRKIFTAIILGLLVLGVSCSKDGVGYKDGNESAIQLQVNFSNQPSRLSGFNKPGTITRVKLEVTGPGMDLISQNLTLSSGKASGSVSVPKGSSRKFAISGIDGNGIVQFDGDATANINADNESVSITAAWIAPPTVTLTLGTITATDIIISWSQSNVEDFSFYRVLISTTNNLDPDLDKVVDITNRSQTSFTIAGLSANTTYYVAVLVVDTEMLYNGANTQVKQFTTQASGGQTFELYYDDNSNEGRVYASAGDWLSVQFAASSYPVFLQKLKIYLIGNSNNGGLNAIVWDDVNGVQILSETVPATVDGWIEITPNWAAQSHDGIMNGDFDIGIEYVLSGMSGVGPFVAADTNSVYASGHEWYRATGGSWVPLNTALGGKLWNLMIRAIVQTSSGKVLELAPSRVGASSFAAKKSRISPDLLELLGQKKLIGAISN